jgi:hypothetical protein
MPSAVNASPAKVYVMLFALVVVGYVIFVIMKSLKNTNVEVEHFMDEHPNYKYRMEVMKVFDLYLNRNPNTEELEKYSKIQNEQDILLAILQDFQINVNDIDASKLTKYSGVGVEEEFLDTNDQLVQVEDADTSITQNDPVTDIPLIEPTSDIKISRETFNDIKAQLKALYDTFVRLDI